MHNMTSIEIMSYFGITKHMCDNIGHFLQQYIVVADDSPFSDVVVIRQAISELINNGVFTIQELQREILRESSVFLPIDFIKDCAG